MTTCLVEIPHLNYLYTDRKWYKKLTPVMKRNQFKEKTGKQESAELGLEAKEAVNVSAIVNMKDLFQH